MSDFRIKYIYKIIHKITYVIYRIKLKKYKFTIISSNCIGGIIYQDLHIQASSPTIDLYFNAPDFIQFLNKMPYYLGCSLTFTKKTKYSEIDSIYPIGALDDVEIHFMHYKSDKDALLKWEQRKKRIEFDNLFIIMTDRDFCTYDIIKEFDNLPYKNKIIFTAKHYPEFKSAIYCKHFEDQDSVGILTDDKVFNNYFNIPRWIFSGVTGKPTDQDVYGAN